MFTVYLTDVFSILSTFLVDFRCFVCNSNNTSFLFKHGNQLTSLNNFLFSFSFFFYLGYAEGVPSETWIYSFFSGFHYTNKAFQVGYSFIVVISSLTHSISWQMLCPAFFVIGLIKAQLGLSSRAVHRLSCVPCPERRRGMSLFRPSCHFWCCEPFPNSYLVTSFPLPGRACFTSWTWLGSWSTLRCVNGFFLLSLAFKKNWLPRRVTWVKDIWDYTHVFKKTFSRFRTLVK